METTATSRPGCTATARPRVVIEELKSRSPAVQAIPLTTPAQKDVFELKGQPRGRATVEIHHTGAYNTLKGSTLAEMVQEGNKGLDLVVPGYRYEVLKSGPDFIRVQILNQTPSVKVHAQDPDLIIRSGSLTENGNRFYIGDPVEKFGFTATQDSNLKLTVDRCVVNVQICKGDTAHDVRDRIAEALPGGYLALPDTGSSPAAEVSIVRAEGHTGG